MRAFLVVIFVALCVLIAVAYQAFEQEMTIRRLKVQIASTTEQVKVKEDEIVNAKLKIQQLNDELAPLTKKKEELVKKKDELIKAKGESETSLGTCQKQKTDSEKKKTDAAEALAKLKGDQRTEEDKVQGELQSLQKELLTRDAMICVFVDQTLEEGRLFCEDKKPAQ